MLTHVLYYCRRAAAIALGLTLTGYSAWLSWEHFGALLGPLAAVSAAALFVFCEWAARDRQWHHALILGVLGLASAILSGSVVLIRNADTQAARVQAVETDNLPRTEAQKALEEAKTALSTAEAESKAECRSGRGRACADLDQREAAARKRVGEARSKLVGFGARSSTNPVASVIGEEWAEIFHRAIAVGPSLWLELAAPALLAYGLAPGPRKEAEPGKRPKRRKKRRSPRRPPTLPAAEDEATAQKVVVLRGTRKAS
jgi:hypothetical protein